MMGHKIMFLWKNMDNFPKNIPVSPSILKHCSACVNAFMYNARLLKLLHHFQTSSILKFLSNSLTVRTTKPEKCDIFAQLYQSEPITTTFQNTADIFSTLRNYVKIFLS